MASPPTLVRSIKSKEIYLIYRGVSLMTSFALSAAAHDIFLLHAFDFFEI